jgi:prevent-host-death family protein
MLSQLKTAGSLRVDWLISMITVGAFEAKTHLSMLLDKVAAGEEVVITKHGPVARLLSAKHVDRRRMSEAVEKRKELRKKTTLSDLSWQELRKRSNSARMHRLARSETLTTYDASYLEPAMRLGLPLLTRDRSLAKAAKRSGVSVPP